MTKENMEKIKKQAFEFLRNNNAMVIATVSVSCEPQASTVYFTADNDFNLFFITPVNTRKYDNLKNNQKVAFVVGTGPDVITIQGGGVAKEVPEKEKKVFYDIIENALKPNDQWPLLVFDKEGYSVFKITPSWMVLLDLHKEGFKDTIDGNFYKII